MKLPSFLRALICTVLLLGLSGGRAQFAGAKPQTGLNAAMMKLFGDIGGFTSQANVRMIDKSNVESMSLPLSFAMLSGKVRAEIDLGQVKSKDMPADAAATLKSMGLDKMVSIVRPDKKLTIVVYPTLRAYAEAPMSAQDAADLDKKYTVRSVKMSDETLDGHRCEKNRVTVTADNGQKHEAIVWSAADLQKFPLQIQMNQADGTVVMHFTKVQLVKPDAKLFDAPAGFAKQASVEKLMQDAMMKALGK